MSRSELRLLLSALPAYLDHLAAHPHSLLCRFMGLHAITAPGGKKVRRTRSYQLYIIMDGRSVCA